MTKEELKREAVKALRRFVDNLPEAEDYGLHSGTDSERRGHGFFADLEYIDFTIELKGKIK